MTRSSSSVAAPAVAYEAGEFRHARRRLHGNLVWTRSQNRQQVQDKASGAQHFAPLEELHGARAGQHSNPPVELHAGSPQEQDQEQDQEQESTGRGFDQGRRLDPKWYEPALATEDRRQQDGG